MSLVGFKARNHPQQRVNPDVDDRATEPSYFADLHQRFRFTVDVAAAAHNTKLPRYYTVEQDGLRQPWTGERVWCNPPYSAIWPWVQKAWAETEADLIVMLLPNNRAEQRWWQRDVEPHRDRPGSRLRVEFLPGRPRFIRKGNDRVYPNERPPFGVCLLIWSKEAHGPISR